MSLTSIGSCVVEVSLVFFQKIELEHLFYLMSSTHGSDTPSSHCQSCRYKFATIDHVVVVGSRFRVLVS